MLRIFAWSIEDHAWLCAPLDRSEVSAGWEAIWF